MSRCQMASELHSSLLATRDKSCINILLSLPNGPAGPCPTCLAAQEIYLTFFKKGAGATLKLLGDQARVNK